MIEGIEEYLTKLENMSGIEQELFQCVDECGTFVAADARERVAVDTGDLRKSITHTTKFEKSEIISTVHTNSDHATYVEFGTGPVGAANHEGISPEAHVSYRPTKWLGKIPELAGQQGKKDQGFRYISGQPAKPYLYPALKDNEDQILKKLEGGIKEIMEKHSNG